MSRRDEQAAGYLLLLLIYVIYTIAMYVYDKFKIGYDFILTFYSQNSDTIFWLIIAIVAAFVWYLCGWLGSKKKNKLETTKVEPTAKPEIKSEPNLNPQKKYIPEMESASPLRHDPECEASYRIEDAISSPSIYRHAEMERSTPEIASSLKKVVEAASEDDLQSINPTAGALSSSESERLHKPISDIIPDEDSALAILAQLKMEGIDVPPCKIEDRLKILIEMLHMPEEEAKRGTLNYFRRYRQLEAKYATSITDFYRSPNWIELAKQIRERDNFTCQRCGKYGPNGGGELHVHHKIPRGRGGSDDPSNLITLCSDCHAMQPHHERLRNN